VTLVGVIILAIGMALHSWREGLIGAITLIGASIGNSLLKISIARERPDLLEPIIEERGFSFPSGHAALSMVAYGTYGTLAVLVWRSSLPAWARRATVAGCAVLVFLVGLSRIWLGVHYPTDVAAGWIAGAVVVLLSAVVSHRVSTGRAAAGAAADREAPRSDRPGPG
jgi:undecaprenyl-diphosphatase